MNFKIDDVLDYLNNRFRILFLGYDNTPLIDFLKKNNCDIHIITDKKINKDIVKNFDFIISYGYRHIIKKDIIDLFENKIINLHISYLPYNRGADPNLWSLLDNTPSGVTIHFIDEGLDTGDILCQKLVQLDYEHDTLKTSYEKLHTEVVTLFINNWTNIKNNKIIPKKQKNSLKTEHKLKDRPNEKIIMTSKWDTKLNIVRKLYIENYKK